MKEKGKEKMKARGDLKGGDYAGPFYGTSRVLFTKHYLVTGLG
jgi:hypothetical protein